MRRTLPLAEILAAILVLGASGFAPGCDSCGSGGGGESSFWFALVLSAVVVWWGLVLVLNLCLDPYRGRLGAWRIALLAFIVIPLPPLGLLLGAQAHLSGRPSWIVPITMSIALGLGWVAVVRIFANRSRANGVNPSRLSA